MRKSVIRLAAGCGAMLLLAIVCGVAASLGLDQWLGTLPTPSPLPPPIVGKPYWVNALLPPAGLPAGLVATTADVFNKPGDPLTDPSVTIIAVVPNATELTLTGVQGEWCYIQGTVYPLRDYGIPDYVQAVEGWLTCDRLLDFPPTPYPTPNTTPQPPPALQLTLIPPHLTPGVLDSMRLSQYELVMQYDPLQWVISTDEYGFSSLGSTSTPDCQIHDGGVAEFLGESRGSIAIGELTFDLYERLAEDGAIIREYLAVAGPGLPGGPGKPFLIVTIPPTEVDGCLVAAHSVLSTLRPIN